MKDLKYIFVFTALILFSCGRSMQEKETVSAKEDSTLSFENARKNDEPEMSFLSDTLNEKQKELFGKRAIQKLEDYYGYMEIISNKKYNTTLRDHARSLAKELFLDKENIILAPDSIANAQDSLCVTIYNIAISSSPQSMNDSIYKGKVVFEEQIGANAKQTRSRGFIIKKIRKNFGSEQNFIWETYLEK